MADSALYSDSKLQKRAETHIKWIPRVPATLSDAQAALTQADAHTMAPLTEGYRYHVLPSTYGVEAFARTFGPHPDWAFVLGDLAVCGCVGVVSLAVATWAYSRAAVR